MKMVLHVGCGPYTPAKLHPAFRGTEWKEVRLDIDPGVKPDIVASITAMDGVADGSVDAVFSSHNIEHLYAHEVPLALKEFRRVLNPDGIALVTLPDVQRLGEAIAAGKLEEPLYQSSAGPISAIDILWGHRASIGRGNTFMAHRTGFTAQTLMKHIIGAGFGTVLVQRDGFDLWAVAYRQHIAAEVRKKLGQGMRLRQGLPVVPVSVH